MYIKVPMYPGNPDVPGEHRSSAVNKTGGENYTGQSSICCAATRTLFGTDRYRLPPAASENYIYIFESVQGNTIFLLNGTPLTAVSSMNPAIIVTMSRLFVAPVFAYLFIYSFRSSDGTGVLWGAVAIAVFIELSDAVDGLIARQRNEVTNFGKLFDPLCDSLSRQTIFLSFMVSGIIPLWMSLVFLYRDGLMAFLRTLCAYNGTVVAARKSGKLKAIFQAAATFLVLGVCLLHSYDIQWVPSAIWGRHPGFWIMLFPTFFTFISIFDYLIPHWKTIRRMLHSDTAQA
jgi:CDP-diacylglycerol--glycerol-3-phosphate 3-phosphatidyltransferase